MKETETFPLRWMLQICKFDVWKNCGCGYFHFYDAAKLMERALEDYKDPLESTASFSLAAACVVCSYLGRHRDEEEGCRVLMLLLVHRLQRVRRNDSRLKVTYSSIERQLNELEARHARLVQEHWNSAHFSSPIEERTDDQLFLDMLDYAEGRTNVSPPPIPSAHSDCPSQHFDLVGHKIDWYQLHQTSQEILSHIQKGCMTDYEKQIALEAAMLSPTGKLRAFDCDHTTSIQEALAFRAIGKFLPHVSCLVRCRLQFNAPPENFWIREGIKSLSSIPKPYFWQQL